ncbi:UNVERIFIED_CONTAM: hypothetical protein K2H54_039536 [Gekko kuhli]
MAGNKETLGCNHRSAGPVAATTGDKLLGRPAVEAMGEALGQTATAATAPPEKAQAREAAAEVGPPGHPVAAATQAVARAVAAEEVQAQAEEALGCLALVATQTLGQLAAKKVAALSNSLSSLQFLSSIQVLQLH